MTLTRTVDINSRHFAINKGLVVVTYQSNMTMVGQVVILVLIMLELDMLAEAASSCIAEMVTCTQQMTSDFKAATNTSMLCGVMGAYMNCIECTCNVSLTPCDLANAKSSIANLLKEYGVHCHFNPATYDDACNVSKATTQTTSIVLLFVTFHVLLRFTFHLL